MKKNKAPPPTPPLTHDPPSPAPPPPPLRYPREAFFFLSQSSSHGTPPTAATRENVATFKRQLKMLGFSYDWAREIDTTDAQYVRWTQWIFLKLFERGLAYQDEIPVNWCPGLGTVLANEEVHDGKSEVGGFPVERRPMRQWMLRITAYAYRLANDPDAIDCPESLKEMQRNSIGPIAPP